MSKHAMEASFDNIEQNLIELIADFLDSEAVALDEAIGLISDPEKSENTELHIRMAMAAMNEYKKTVTYDGSEKKQKRTPLFYEDTSLVKMKEKIKQLLKDLKTSRKILKKDKTTKKHDRKILTHQITCFEVALQQILLSELESEENLNEKQKK